MKNYKYLLLGVFFSSTSLFALTLNEAKKLAEKADAAAKKEGFAASVAVVNAEGTLLYFQRADGAPRGSVKASQAKALASASYGLDTNDAVNAIAGQKPQYAYLPDMTAVAGGVVLKEGDTVVGAIGVSGAADDQADHRAAIAAKAPDAQ